MTTTTLLCSFFAHRPCFQTLTKRPLSELGVSHAHSDSPPDQPAPLQSLSGSCWVSTVLWWDTGRHRPPPPACCSSTQSVKANQQMTASQLASLYYCNQRERLWMTTTTLYWECAKWLSYSQRLASWALLKSNAICVSRKHQLQASLHRDIHPTWQITKFVFHNQIPIHFPLSYLHTRVLRIIQIHM